MKFLCLWGILACIFAANKSFCQVKPPLNQRPIEKPALFSQLPERISCAAASLQNIFTTSIDSNISITLGPKLKVEGIVIAKAAITPDQLSINIRCNNFEEALLNLSRITENNGTVKYVGRMVSPQHGDVLLLWEENGQYSFIRQKLLLTMVE